MNRDTAKEPEFVPASFAVLTVSDSRELSNDSSGDLLCERLQTAGHQLAARQLVSDDIFRIRAAVSGWIADPAINGILITGGTGITGRDSTPEAVRPLLVREIPGFGEVFRYLSLEDIGASAIQSRALAGSANGTLLFVMPGSTGACRLAWDRIIATQMDSRTQPCNFITLLKRLQE